MQFLSNVLDQTLCCEEERLFHAGAALLFVGAEPDGHAAVFQRACRVRGLSDHNARDASLHGNTVNRRSQGVLVRSDGTGSNIKYYERLVRQVNTY